MTINSRNQLRAVGRLLVVCATAIAAAATIPVAAAQTARCTTTAYTDPPRQVLRCADGLTIHAERNADYRLVDDDGDGQPEAAELNGRALLIEFPAGRRGRFQILTPHAIAAVRGTIWAVDVGASRSSIFVERGAVAVSRRGGVSVVLNAGEGVDVEAGQSPLKVNRWGTRRVLALKARFGR